VTAEHWIGLVVCVGLTAYLLYALVAADRM
jgi:K+-transporting ATPase KdpF subunit